MNPATALLILRMVDLLAAGLQFTGESRARYDRLSAKVKTMIEEGRDPTEQEFDELFAESDALTERLRAARAAKDSGGEA